MSLVYTLMACGAMAAACAVLSVVVVVRRWAFIGEGIAHAGFGGVGTAWALALVMPAGDAFVTPPVMYAIAIAFCLLTALGIGVLTRHQRVHPDTAIGIFLVAALAWGFLAQAIYAHVRHAPPPGWQAYLLGELHALTGPFAVVTCVVAVGVIAVLVLLGKEVVAYCFDPAMAELSGVPVRLVHYLLVTLLAIVIVLAMRVMGQLLVTALLVLPGAAALQTSRRLGTVLAVSVGVAVAAAIVGPLLHARWSFIPPGPAIALTLLLEFLLAYALTALRPRSTPAA